MSYSIRLYETCSTCGHREGDSTDPTYNMAPMFRLALTPKSTGDGPHGVKALHGRKGSETVEQLQAGLGALSDPANARKLAEMEEACHGWGSIEGAKTVLRRLIQMAEAYPNAVWSVT